MSESRKHIKPVTLESAAHGFLNFIKTLKEEAILSMLQRIHEMEAVYIASVHGAS
jgi:hypothetical protein